MGLLGSGKQVPSPPAINSPSIFPKWGPSRAPENLDFWTFIFWDLKNHIRTVFVRYCSFLIERSSQYVVNEGADKLNSIDSVLVDIENVVIV